MPTSGTRRRPSDGPRLVHPRRAREGFTLLEMLVVLAIVGLVAAVAVPTTVRGIGSWRRQAQVDAVADQVRGLPGRARASGAGIVVSNETLAGEAPPLRVADGWRLLAPEPLEVTAAGACQGGLLELQGDGQPVLLRVAAPFCDPVRE